MQQTAKAEERAKVQSNTRIVADTTAVVGVRPAETKDKAGERRNVVNQVLFAADLSNAETGSRIYIPAVDQQNNAHLSAAAAAGSSSNSSSGCGGCGNRWWRCNPQLGHSASTSHQSESSTPTCSSTSTAPLSGTPLTPPQTELVWASIRFALVMFLRFRQLLPLGALGGEMTVNLRKRSKGRFGSVTVTVTFLQCFHVVTCNSVSR
jgi:hypothetical protein